MREAGLRRSSADEESPMLGLAALHLVHATWMGIDIPQSNDDSRLCWPTGKSSEGLMVSGSGSSMMDSRSGFRFVNSGGAK